MQAADPSTCVTLMVGVLQLSVAVTKAVILALVGRFVGLQPKLAPVGTEVSIGAVVSTKVMLCVQVALLPQASVAFQIRAMPALPVQSAAVGESEYVIVTAPPQLSVAVALPVLDVLVEAPHCNWTLAGQVITGGVVSTKVIVCTQVELLPQASVAFHVREMPALPVQFAAVGVSE
jgi:hypothetical protein